MKINRLKVITSDNRPYGLHRARDENFFIGEKIISVRKGSRPVFTFTGFDCFVSQTFYVIKTDRFNLKYLTSLLNSKLIAFWLRYKGKMQGNNYQIDKAPLLQIPIIQASKEDEEEIADKVTEIIQLKSESKNSSILEAQIDQLVYRLYNSTYEEVKIIDPEFSLSEEDYEKQQF